MVSFPFDLLVRTPERGIGECCERFDAPQKKLIGLIERVGKNFNSRAKKEFSN